MSEKIILDWNEYLDAARTVVAEGCVLLKNENSVLPFKNNSTISVFGRIQNHYYKSGTGSGGMVNVTKVTSIVEGLEESGVVRLNKNLQEIYSKWEETNPFEEGMGWGNEPWSQKEMPVSLEIAEAAAKESDAALVIIGRTAGEDRDATLTEGSYLLTATEKEMLKNVRKAFNKMAVILNVGSIIDMSFVDEIKPDSVMYVWQGGMNGGNGTADVRTGKTNPSGKLTDTIARSIKDYPSDKYFGSEIKNYYCEDIYVGYRYFETFNKDAVVYPFGFGLSYTTFEINHKEAEFSDTCFDVTVEVKNTGNLPGKEVVQIYVGAPQGKLGKPAKVLAGYAKTCEIKPGETDEVKINVPFKNFASYDDGGLTGNKSCFILEKGEYKIYIGNSVRDSSEVYAFEIEEDTVLEQLEEAMAPLESFNRMKPAADGSLSEEKVPLYTVDMTKRRLERLPEEIPYTGEKGIKLRDVLEEKNTMDQFIAQFNDEELCSFLRGEGMGSSRVTAGTASAFGGVAEALVARGIPAVCTDDGPSGMRLDCGTKAFSLPNGTMNACTFNPDLIEYMYTFTGWEMVSKKVECLLGPGMNIHRHPLNGRNFEYFSEDPLVTGITASAMLHGLENAGVTGTIKHFCGNNQETKRHWAESVISERALREIYLRGFEIAVKDGGATTVMTTYGPVNGLWTAGNYDLCTTILRKEWGFKGVVMTDWWAKISEFGVEPNLTNFAGMCKAQNDLFMCCPDGNTNASGDNALEELQKGNLKRSELQRTAKNVCECVMETQAMNRLLGTAPEVEIINAPKDPSDIDMSTVEFTVLDGEYTRSLEEPKSVKDTSYIFAFDVQKNGTYRVTLSASSPLSELAQTPVTLFFNGFPVRTFTFNGTNGATVEISEEMPMAGRFVTLRLYVPRNGVDLKEIKFQFVKSEFQTFFDEVKGEE